MNNEWITVYTTTTEYIAQMIQDILSDHNIEVIVMNKKDSSYVVIGEIEIHVRKDNEHTAKQLINSILNNE